MQVKKWNATNQSQTSKADAGNQGSQGSVSLPSSLALFARKHWNVPLQMHWTASLRPASPFLEPCSSQPSASTENGQNFTNGLLDSIQIF